MKKIFTLTLITVFIFGFAACSKAEDNTSKKNDSSMISSTENTEKGKFLSEKGHKVKGTVEIKGDKIYLKDFSTDEGPDLHIFLSNGKNVENAKEISTIDLKQTEQEFTISKEDVSMYDTVLIYCNKAHELFGSAKI